MSVFYVYVQEEGGRDIYYNCFKSYVAIGRNPEKCWKYRYYGILKN
jgi:hypothetical protein